MLTACQELERKHRQQQEAMRLEMKALAEKEFPVGVTVSYVYTYTQGGNAIYRKAVVKGYTSFGVELKGPSGGIFTKYAYQLEKEEPTS